MAKFDVFLSHNSKDKPAVEQIARRLKSERDLKVWLDKWNLVPGEPWQEEIEEALDQCQTYAVFLGPSGIGPWENEEMRVALDERVQDKKRRVIPVLLPGAPDNKTLKLPRFLKRLTWVDFRKGLDDKIAFHYLVCGIKGIPPGDISCPDVKPAEGALPEPGDLPTGSRMPFTRNTLFTGRTDPLLALAKTLIEEQNGKSLVTQAVHGMGGIGKTQLAVEFCYRYGHFLHGVHWLNAAEPGGLKAEIATCGREMGLSFGDAPLDEQVSQTLHAWKSDGPRLVVLDNFEDTEAVRLWLPQLGHSALRLLVTARRSDWPADLGLCLLPLAIFTPEEGRAFLRLYLPIERTSDQELDTLASRLGHLPLALELAGRYLQAHPRMTMAEYIEQLKQALAHPSMRAWKKGLGNPTGHDLDLLATFSVSWEQEKDKNARLVYMLCGYCAPNEPIPLELLEVASGLEKNALDEALALLTGCGLLLPAPAMHPLLAEFARLAAQEKKGKEKPLEKIAHSLAVLARQANDQIDQTGRLDWFDPLRAHLLPMAEHAEAAGLEVAASLLGSLGYYLEKVADYQGAKAAYERALKSDEKTYGPDHPTVAIRVNNLGSVLKDLGDLAGAKAAYERALKIWEANLGPDHPQVATGVNNLGSVLQDLGDLAGAKAAFERALKIFKQFLPPGHPRIKIVEDNLRRLENRPDAK
jgi:tetratricopeptide (TPR) repeat protein